MPAEKFELKALVLTKRYDYGHCVGQNFKGKKVKAGYRGSSSIDIMVSRDGSQTAEDSALANRVLDKILAHLDEIILNPYAEEFSPYHNVAAIFWKTAPGFEALAPVMHIGARLTLDQARELDKILD